MQEFDAGGTGEKALYFFPQVVYIMKIPLAKNVWKGMIPTW
jgi:hypothetical protein